MCAREILRKSENDMATRTVKTRRQIMFIKCLFEMSFFFIFFLVRVTYVSMADFVYVFYHFVYFTGDENPHARIPISKEKFHLTELPTLKI